MSVVRGGSKKVVIDIMVLSRIRGFIPKSSLEIIPHLYQLTIRGVNMILIVEEELTLIDTGFRGSSVRIAGFVRSLGRSVAEISLIIITHNHIDHAGGLAELRRLTRAKVAAHKADIEGQPSNLGPGQKTLRVSPSSVLQSVFSVKSSEVDIHLLGGEVFKPLGGLKVVHTPGHTPGSISLFSPQKKILIVADALSKRGRNPWLPHKMVSTDFRQALDSIRGISRLDFDILCFGHGRPLTENVQTKMQELIKKNKD